MKDDGKADRFYLALVWTLCLGGLAIPGSSVKAQSATFVRGDANSDGRVSLSDAVMIRRYVFNGQRAPACLDAADADDNGSVQLTDTIRVLLNFFPNPGVTWGTLAIAMPYPDPGVDATPDPDGDLGCLSNEIVPAEATDDVIRIGEVEAAPGEEVSVPVFLTSSVDVDAVQVVLKYDPALFTPKSGSIHNAAFDLEGTFYSRLNSPGADWFAAIQAHPDDGLLTIGIVGNIVLEGHEIPPGTDTLIFKFVGTVSPSAQVGTTLSLEPTNGPEGQGVKPPLLMRNELTHKGEARFASTLPKTVPGLIAIVDDITFFIRGDANGDQRVDISDPIFILAFLYLGSEKPSCMDAADADDSGELGLTDAIVILTQLFSGESKIMPPFPSASGDPTPDDLPRCRAR